jgi:hypothetical protein
MEIAILAYAAGLVDGEGSFTLDIVHSPHGKKYTSYVCRAVVVNTDQECLYFLQKHFEGSVFQRTKESDKRKATYVWRIFGENLEAFCKLILPFSIIKKRHIELILAFRKLYWNRRGEVTPSLHAEREKYYIAMRQLNQTGPYQKQTLASDCHRELCSP